MSEKIYTATISPNRTTPRRYIRMVCYRRTTDPVRDVDVVGACLFVKEPDKGATAEHLPYSRIHESAVDPEFEAAWLDHVAAQDRTHLTLAQRRA